MIKEKYSWITGLLKAIKNNAVIFGGAGILYLLQNWTEWIPKEYMWLGSLFGGIAAYMAKNYAEFGKPKVI